MNQGVLEGQFTQITHFLTCVVSSHADRCGFVSRGFEISTSKTSAVLVVGRPTGSNKETIHSDACGLSRIPGTLFVERQGTVELFSAET